MLVGQNTRPTLQLQLLPLLVAKMKKKHGSKKNCDVAFRNEGVLLLILIKCVFIYQFINNKGLDVD